ncbi:MAG: glycosyltransferase [Proteobacteria bacterium]|nr:glycosyltransferase [Pseudomonadota bacterium]
MKVLYGVQGTGNGHITRALAITQALSNYPDVNIDVLISGRNPEPLDLPVSSLKWKDGLTFVTESGQVKKFRTVLRNNPVKLARDISAQAISDYDLIISDYEPIVAWASRLKGGSCIGIGHQYAFRFNVPLRGADRISLSILKYMAPADNAVGLHWHHFDQPILPPIVDIDVQARTDLQHSVQSNKVVVYLPFEDQHQVIALLEKCPDFEFYIYAPVLRQEDNGNIHCRQTSRTTFKADLLSANAVICNTGFELISECLALGIRVLTKPLDGQVEQLSNAAALRELEYATVIDNLFLPSVEKWLKSGRTVRVSYPSVQTCLARWLAAGAREPVESLAEKMWRDVSVTCS